MNTINLKLWHKTIYPLGQWLTIAREGISGTDDDINFWNDDEIYFYYDKPLESIKVGDVIELDEDFKVLEVEE